MTSARQRGDEETFRAFDAYRIDLHSALLDNHLFLIKDGGFSYDAVNAMPVSERQAFSYKLRELIDARIEAMKPK